MTWVRVDEGFPEHPKVLAAGDEAAWLFVCALCYCNRHLTDGFVPSPAIKRLTNHKNPIRLAMKLVDVGLFDRVNDGFEVHDFLHYQPSKAAITTERAAARERMANARARSKDVRANAPPNVQQNNGRSSPNPVRPGPSRPSQSSSSNGSSIRHPTAVDDDDQFMKTIRILVEHKAEEHKPRSRRAWEATTVPTTIEEDGAQVRSHIEAGRDPVSAAAIIIGSRAAAELAAGRL